MQKSLFPGYTVGPDAYDDIVNICPAYGKKAAIIGGKKALAAAEDKIRKAVEGSGIEIIGTFWYGGEASRENMDMLRPQVADADMIFAVGGGKAIDTAKAVAHRQHKPYFTFPTVAGSCAAAASIATIYTEDGKFQDYLYSNIPPIHVFLCSRIMAQAPVEYLLRGIVDTMAKYYEASIASRGRKLQHRDGMGIALSRMCVDPLYAYGEQAVADNRRHVVSPAFEEVILSIVMTSGLVSNFAAPEFNGHIAHQLFVELSDLPTSEQCRQHGGLVAYGILLLLLCDGQEEEFRRFYAFCQSIGLPTSRKATGASETEIQRVFRATEKKQDVRIMPYKVTQDMLHEAAEKLEAYHSEQE